MCDSTSDSRQLIRGTTTGRRDAHINARSAAGGSCTQAAGRYLKRQCTTARLPWRCKTHSRRLHVLFKKVRPVLHSGKERSVNVHLHTLLANPCRIQQRMNLTRRSGNNEVSLLEAPANSSEVLGVERQNAWGVVL